jgi:hypothetical protein
MFHYGRGEGVLRTAFYGPQQFQELPLGEQGVVAENSLLFCVCMHALVPSLASYLILETVGRASVRVPVLSSSRTSICVQFR